MASENLPLFSNSGYTRRAPVRKRVQPPLKRFFGCERQTISENDSEPAGDCVPELDTDAKESCSCSEHSKDCSRTDCNGRCKKMRNLYGFGSPDHENCTRQLTSGCTKSKQMSSISNWTNHSEQPVLSPPTSPGSKQIVQDKEAGSHTFSKIFPSQKLFKSPAETFSSEELAVENPAFSRTEAKYHDMESANEATGEIVPDSEEESEGESGGEPKLVVNRMRKEKKIGNPSFLPDIPNATSAERSRSVPEINRPIVSEDPLCRIFSTPVTKADPMTLIGTGHGVSRKPESSPITPSVSRNHAVNLFPDLDCTVDDFEPPSFSLGLDRPTCRLFQAAEPAMENHNSDDSDDRELLMFNVNGKPGAGKSRGKTIISPSPASKADFSSVTDAFTSKSANSHADLLGRDKPSQPFDEDDLEAIGGQLPRKRLKRLQRKSEAAEKVCNAGSSHSSHKEEETTKLKPEKVHKGCCGSKQCGSVPEKLKENEGIRAGRANVFMPANGPVADEEEQDDIETASSDEEISGWQRRFSEITTSNTREDFRCRERASDQIPKSHSARFSMRDPPASFSTLHRGADASEDADILDQSPGWNRQPCKLSPLFRACELKSNVKSSEENRPSPANLAQGHERQKHSTPGYGHNQSMTTKTSTLAGASSTRAPVIHLDSDNNEGNCDERPSGEGGWSCRMDGMRHGRGGKALEAMVRMRLPHFRSVSHLEQDEAGEPVYIDYRNQFGGAKSNARSNVRSSGDQGPQLQPKQKGRGVSRGEGSGGAQVAAGMTGKWRVENGQRVYINRQGKTLFGRVAYLESLKENPNKKKKPPKSKK